MGRSETHRCSIKEALSTCEGPDTLMSHCWADPFVTDSSRGGHVVTFILGGQAWS